MEAIAVAYSADDEERVERVLREAAIAYEVTLDVPERDAPANACSLGCVYVVATEVAGHARAALRRAGLTALVPEQR